MTLTKSSPNIGNHSFRRLFFWQLKQHGLLSVFYTLTLLLCPANFFLCISSEWNYYMTDNTIPYAERMFNLSQSVVTSLANQLATALFPVLIFAVLFAVSIFGYMHRRRSVDLFHAIPVRRITLLMSGYWAGLLLLLVPLGVMTAVCYFIGVFSHLSLPFSGLLLAQAFGLMTLMAAASYTLTVFFLTSFGTLLDAFFSLAAAMVGWMLLVDAIDMTIRQMLPGYASTLAGYTAFAPYLAAFQMLNSYNADYCGVSVKTAALNGTLPFSVSLLSVVWWALFTVVFLLLTIRFYCKRKSESAENSDSARSVRCVVAFIVAGACGLLCAIIGTELYSSNLLFIILVVVGGFAGSSVCQMVWMRGVRHYWRCLPVAAAAVVCCGGFLWCLHIDVTGFVKRIPVSSDVASVDITLPTYNPDGSVYVYRSEYNTLSLMDSQEDWLSDLTPDVSNPETISLICQLHNAVVSVYDGTYSPCDGSGAVSGLFSSEEETTQDSSYFVLNLTYHKKNGSTFVRNYLLTEEQCNAMSEAMSALIRTEEYTRYQLLDTYTGSDVLSVETVWDTDANGYDATNNQLTSTEQEQLWSTFLDELNSDTFTYTESPNYADNQGKANYYIYLQPKQISTLSESLQQELMDYAASSIELRGSDPTAACNGGTFYAVPSACTKTRALIDQLTEPYGEYYNYSDDNNAVENDIVPSAESSSNPEPDTADSSSAPVEASAASSSAPAESAASSAT